LFSNSLIFYFSICRREISKEKISYFFLEIENRQIFFYSFSDLERTENINGENKLEIVFCVAGCIAKNFRNTPQLAVIEMQKF